MRRPVRPVITVLLLAALVLAGCSDGGGDTSTIRQELDAQSRAQQALRDRIDELQGTLDQLTDIGEGRSAEVAAEVADRLEALDTAIASLQAALDALEATHGDDEATTQAALGDLDGRMVDVTTTLSALEDAFADLQREVSDLKADHDLLRAQFERHVEDHG